MSPRFFPGGDLGKLAVSGTVNDLVVSGAKPRYLSAAFILEEGLPYAELEKIVFSLANEVSFTETAIACGDTKVVPVGQADGIFINTAGIGEKIDGADWSPFKMSEGDEVIVTGCIGDHGAAILASREDFGFEGKLKSDCASLTPLLNIFQKFRKEIKVMRDPTRGGIATTLNELAIEAEVEIELEEEKIPVKDEVRSFCRLLGLDPLYLACEGRALIVVDKNASADLLEALRSVSLSSDASIIGSLKKNKAGVILQTYLKGKRRLGMLAGEPLPRIC